MKYTLDMLNKDRIKLAEKYAMQFAKYAVGDKIICTDGNRWVITGLVVALPYGTPYLYYRVLKVKKDGSPYKNNQSGSLVNSSILRKL